MFSNTIKSVDWVLVLSPTSIIRLAKVGTFSYGRNLVSNDLFMLQNVWICTLQIWTIVTRFILIIFINKKECFCLSLKRLIKIVTYDRLELLEWNLNILTVWQSAYWTLCSQYIVYLVEHFWVENLSNFQWSVTTKYIRRQTWELLIKSQVIQHTLLPSTESSGGTCHCRICRIYITNRKMSIMS